MLAIESSMLCMRLVSFGWIMNLGTDLFFCPLKRRPASTGRVLVMASSMSSLLLSAVAQPLCQSSQRRIRYHCLKIDVNYSHKLDFC